MDEAKRRFPFVSSAALVVANLVPVGFVLFQGWGVYYILVLFWLENVGSSVRIPRTASSMYNLLSSYEFSPLSSFPYPQSTPVARM